MAKVLANTTAAILKRRLYGQRDPVSVSPAGVSRPSGALADESIARVPPPFTVRWSVPENTWLCRVPSGSVRFAGLAPTIANAENQHRPDWYEFSYPSGGAVYAALTLSADANGNAVCTMEIGDADANATANILVARCDNSTKIVEQYQVGNLLLPGLADLRYDSVNYQLIRVAPDGTETVIIQFEPWDYA